MGGRQRTRSDHPWATPAGFSARVALEGSPRSSVLFRRGGSVLVSHFLQQERVFVAGDLNGAERTEGELPLRQRHDT